MCTFSERGCRSPFPEVPVNQRNRCAAANRVRRLLRLTGVSDSFGAGTIIDGRSATRSPPRGAVNGCSYRREFATSARPEREYYALLRGFDYLMIPRETRPGVPDGCDADPPGASAGATRGAVAAASGATPQSPTERTNPADWRPITTVIGRQNRRLAMRCAGAGVSTERTRAAGAAAGRAWLRWPAGRRQACEFSRARAQGPAGSDSSHLSLVPST